MKSKRRILIYFFSLLGSLAIAQSEKDEISIWEPSGDGDFELRMEIEMGYRMMSPNPVAGSFEPLNSFSHGVGLSLKKRLGYSTYLDMGASYNEFIQMTLPSSGKFDLRNTIQFPLRFYKVFPSRSSSQINMLEERKIIIPSGFLITVGGYYGLNTKFFQFNSVREDESESDANDVYGVSAGIGYAKGRFSFILEARQDLIAIYNFSFPDEDWKRLVFSARFSFRLVDF